VNSDSSSRFPSSQLLVELQKPNMKLISVGLLMNLFAAELIHAEKPRHVLHQNRQAFLNGDHYNYNYYNYLRRQLQELLTLEKIDKQLEMLQVEMEEMREEGNTDDYLVHRVQEQINITLARKEDFLAAQKNKDATTTTQNLDAAVVDQEAYEETKEENMKAKEEEEILEEEEHWYRYILLALFALGSLVYLRSRYLGGSLSERYTAYQKIYPSEEANGTEIELGAR